MTQLPMSDILSKEVSRRYNMDRKKKNKSKYFTQSHNEHFARKLYFAAFFL